MNIPLDKRLHFAAGIVITIVVSYLLHNPIYGLAAGLFAGLMKELRDWCIYRGFDYKDMLATWIGGLAGFAIAELLKVIT